MQRQLVFFSLALAALFAGCRKEEIRAYRVPKERPAPSALAEATPVQPHIRFHTPPGWEEEPSGKMRVASFIIHAPGGAGAEVAVIPFQGMGGSDLQFVNLWRQQAGLPAATEAELPNLMSKAAVGAGEGKVFDISGERTTDKGRQNFRVVVAVLARGNTTWFFKLDGDPPVVEKEKKAFLEFLQSVEFVEAPALAEMARPSSAPEAVPGAAPGKPAWEVPAGWQEVPPTQMLLAKFNLAGEAGSRAEVTVSSFPGTMGGLLANVNRWRGQLGLPGVGESDLPQVVSALDLPGAAAATLVEMDGTDAKTGQQARLIGVIVPRGGATWFFKLMGDGPVAARERAAFLKFVQTVRFPNA